MRARVIALGALAVVLVTACGEAAPQDVAATVNGREIPAERVERALAEFEKTAQFDQLAQQTSEATAKRQFEQAFLAQQVQRLVFRPAAEELGIEVTDQEVQEQLDQIKSQFPSTKEYNKALEDRGFTEAELEQLLYDQILQEKLRTEVTEGTEATRQEVREYYESNADTYRQTRVQHILVEQRGLAQRIADRLDRASKSQVDALFARLAREHSTDKSNRRDAGDLGWVSPGSFVGPFEDAMEELSVGEISDPVRTQFGIHVLRVTGRRTRPFGEVSDEIEARLSGTAAEDAFSEWLRETYEAADVEINPRYGELDPSTGQIRNATAEDVPGADESSQDSGSG